MLIALFKGRSLVPSRLIEFITRSEFSHAAFYFDEGASEAAIRLINQNHQIKKLTSISQGSVVEAWNQGVVNSPSISTLHTERTEVVYYGLEPRLSQLEEEKLVLFCDDIIGWPYGYWNVLKFVTKRPGRKDGSYFCSEAVFEGFRRAGRTLLTETEDWEVPPDWLRRPAQMRRVGSEFTRFEKNPLTASPAVR